MSNAAHTGNGARVPWSTRHIAFAGGGVRGLSYVSALQALRDAAGVDFGARLPRLETAAGSSVGALLAFLIVLGYTVTELLDVATQKLEALIMPSSVPVLSRVWGLNDGAALQTQLRKWVARKLRRDDRQAADQQVGRDVTLAQLREATGMTLLLSVTDVTAGKVLYVTADTHPDLSAVTAVMASMALPLLFPPVQVGGHLWADGGMLDNFPIQQLPPESCLGLTFSYAFQPSLDSFIAYSTRIVGLMGLTTDVSAWALLPDAYKRRCIVIDVGTVSVTGGSGSAMGLTDAERTILWQAGKQYVAQALAAWDTPGAALVPSTYMDPLHGCETSPQFHSLLAACAALHKSKESMTALQLPSVTASVTAMVSSAATTVEGS